MALLDEIHQHWRPLKWGDLATLEYGKGLRGYQEAIAKYPVYGTNGLIGWHDTALCKKPGIIIGRKGAYRGVHLSKTPFFVIDTAFYLNLLSDKVDLIWAYYHLINFDINKIDSGSAIPSTSREAFYQIPVSLPPLSTQHKIAAILSAYDDLIENNTRRIAILEEMVQSLYREWFVHFRFPGHEKKSMVESALGMIPEGWEVKAIGELLKTQIGGGWGQEEKNEEFSLAAYVIRGTDIPLARYVSVEKSPLRYHKKSNLEPRRLQKQDIVFEVSGGSKGQPVGRALFVSQQLLDSFDEDVMCASFCKLLRVDREIILPELIYLNLLEIYENGRIEKYQVQSTGIINFKFTLFLQSELVVIPHQILQVKFREIVMPLFASIQTLGSKNAKLRQTRDLLLPKLISGEVDVERLEIVGIEETGEVETKAVEV
jgi:type I restriction enzyme, S subunit